METTAFVQFNADGTRVLASWGSKGNGNGQFTGPDGIALDASDNVYVTDRETGLIQKFTSAGVFITKWEMKTPTGQVPKFSNPIGIAADTSDRLHTTVYVADYNVAFIQKFSPAGDPLAQWGSPGTGDSQFRSPLGLAVDDVGSVFVVDHGGMSDAQDRESSRVQKFAPSTEYITQ